MSKEKQIEEMCDIMSNECYADCVETPLFHESRGICDYVDCRSCKQARLLMHAGYRKQIEGKWKLHKDGSGTCDQCGTTQKNVWDYDNWQNYCGCCGAEMKGGE